MSPRDKSITEYVVEAHRRLSLLEHPKNDAARADFWHAIGGIQALLELATYRLTGTWPEDCTMPERTRAALADTLPMPPESEVKAVLR